MTLKTSKPTVIVKRLSASTNPEKIGERRVLHRRNKAKA